MEESYETFEEELRPQRAGPPPLKPARQICRPEMYTTRKTREEMAPVSQHTRKEARTLGESSFPRTTSLHKTLSTQNLTQIETPWENVTLNRCLFVAITILVLTSGFQKLQETMRGQRLVEEEEECGMTVRRTGTLRHRGQPPEPQTSLWDVMFWWLPDLDDDEDEEEDNGKAKARRSKKGAIRRTSRGLRNKPLPDRNLMKQRDGKLKDRRAKKAMEEESKVKTERDKIQDLKDEDDEDQDNEEMPEKKNKGKEREETNS